MYIYSLGQKKINFTKAEIVGARLLVDGARDAGAVIVASSAGAANGRHTAQRAEPAAHNAVAIVAAVVARRIAAGAKASVVIRIASASASAQARIVIGQGVGIRVVAAAIAAVAADA